MKDDIAEPAPIPLVKYNSDLWRSHSFFSHIFFKNVISVVFSTTRSEYANNAVEISILLTCDKQMTELNLSHKGKNKPTNVLSFCYQSGLQPSLPNNFLGDIALGYETIKRESEYQSKSFDKHFTHMLVHGILHLMGYRHDSDEEAEMMEKAEIEILEKLNIKNPYV